MTESFRFTCCGVSCFVFRVVSRFELLCLLLCRYLLLLGLPTMRSCGLLLALAGSRFLFRCFLLLLLLLLALASEATTRFLPFLVAAFFLAGFLLLPLLLLLLLPLLLPLPLLPVVLILPLVLPLLPLLLLLLSLPSDPLRGS